MDVPLLIDSIVRQTTVLIAQLATASGTRAPLAHTANQVFLSLVQELKQQGLSGKVIADMFGLALRTYHHRVQRLTESATFRGRSIWEAVFEYVQERGPVLRGDVLRKFGRDDEAQVRAVLSDLVDSQLLSRTGRGESTTYRATTEGDRVSDDLGRSERLQCLVWIAIHRFGPIGLLGIQGIVPASKEELLAALGQLVADERISREGQEEQSTYSSSHYMIPVGSDFGWEAAVFDHYQAMVTAICTKVRGAGSRSKRGEWVGGSTYCYDVTPDHPLHDEVAGFLERVRSQAVDLRERVERYNDAHPLPPEERRRRFLSYVGQTFVSSEDEPGAPS